MQIPKDQTTELIARAINGDTAAFERVMQAKARQIIYVSVKIMRNQQDGEDAAQEAMLKMYQNIDKLKSPDAFTTWMYQIVTRTCIDLDRKRNREEHEYLETQEEVMEELKEMRREFLPQEYIEDVDKREALLKVIDDLPDYYRTCLILFYFEDMTYQQISTVTGISPKTVSNALFRAKQKIKQQLAEMQDVKRELFSFPSVVAMPVLSQIFQMEASECVSTEAVTRILVAASGGLTAAGLNAAATGSGSAASAAATTTTASANTATVVSASAAITTKMVIGVVAAATAVGGAAYSLQPTNTVDAAALLSEQTGEEEAAILTLEDMIGEEAANQLKVFASGQKPDLTWEAFLASISATVHSGADDSQFQYTLYHLEKQDKQLLIVAQLPSRTSRPDDPGSTTPLNIAYRFTDSHEAIPEREALVDSLEGWQS